MANKNDSYDELYAKLSSKDVTFSGKETEVKNNGEIYFSPNSDNNRPVERLTVDETSSGGSAKKTPPAKKSDVRKASSAEDAKKKASKAKKKKKKKKKRAKAAAVLAKMLVTIAVIVVVAYFVKIPLMSCINDVLSLDGSSIEHRVTLTETLEYDEVIDLLVEKELLSNGTFCKFVAKFMDFDDPSYVYAAGDYNLSTAMGVEGMLQEIAHAGSTSSTVSITFPEGYTAIQIAEKLEVNRVCSKSGFLAALEDDALYEEFDILKDIDRTNRLYGVEGYLYPDTYEFYVGEDPSSVVSRFLNNFIDKWSDDYTERAKSLGYSVNEVLTVASILEKEAKDSEQMTLIASILYNRLAAPGYYPFINCDSTAKYLENAKETIDDETRYQQLLPYYDTYQIQGLPVGPISNPGADAIYAALHPDSTSYYYFLHDSEGKIYVARTQSEHEANGAYIN